MCAKDLSEWVVDKIVSHHRDGSGKKGWMFLVRWSGFDESEDSWEPYMNVKDTEALRIYVNSVPGLARSLK